jgi:ribosomal protein L37AE/L43A
MQKLYRNGQKQQTFKPDVLIRGKGVGWSEQSQWYRQSGDDQGNVPLIAKFRPSGWSKSYEYELTFNDRCYNNDKKMEFQLNINRIDDKNNVLSTVPLIGLTTTVNQLYCPFCKNVVILDMNNNMWKCSSHQCQFNYTSDTCRLMYEDNDFKALNKSERRFNDFGALRKLMLAKSDINIDIKKYKGLNKL